MLPDVARLRVDVGFGQADQLGLQHPVGPYNGGLDGLEERDGVVAEPPADEHGLSPDPQSEGPRDSVGDGRHEGAGEAVPRPALGDAGGGVERSQPPGTIHMVPGLGSRRGDGQHRDPGDNEVIVLLELRCHPPVQRVGPLRRDDPHVKRVGLGIDGVGMIHLDLGLENM